MNDGIGVYVINLNTAKERKNLFIEEFKKAGANPEKFNWYHPVRDNQNPLRGSFTSHQNVVKLAKENGYKYALVFEDDAVFIDKFNWEYTYTHIDKFLRDFKGYWKYLSLGFLPIRSKIIDNKEIVEILCAYDAHAYLVNLENVEILKFNPKKQYADANMFCEGIQPVEIGLKTVYKKNKGVYGLNPMIFTQNFKDSSINNESLRQKNFIEFYRGENKMLTSSTNFNTFTYCLLLVVLVFVLVILTIFLLFVKKYYNINTNNLYVYFGILFITLFVYTIVFSIDILCNL